MRARSSSVLWSALGLAAVLFVGAGALILRSHAEQAPLKSHDMEQELTSIREELASLRRSTNQPLQALQRVASLAPTAGGDAGEAEAEPRKPTDVFAGLSDEERRYRYEVVNKARLALTQETYESEVPDPEWSSAATRQLTDFYAGSEVDAVRPIVDCRATLCRVSFSYTEPSQGEAAAKELSSRHAWDGRGFVHLDFNKQEGVSYLSRPGFDMPEVDPSSLTY